MCIAFNIFLLYSILLFIVYSSHNNVHFIYFIFIIKHFYVAPLYNTVLSMPWWAMNDIIIIDIIKRIRAQIAIRTTVIIKFLR